MSDSRSVTASVSSEACRRYSESGTRPARIPTLEERLDNNICESRLRPQLGHSYYKALITVSTVVSDSNRRFGPSCSTYCMGIAAPMNFGEWASSGELKHALLHIFPLIFRQTEYYLQRYILISWPWYPYGATRCRPHAQQILITGIPVRIKTVGLPKLVVFPVVLSNSSPVIMCRQLQIEMSFLRLYFV